jgi:HD-like signal output (HDOD) protein/ActR/RegA family two-component response regulator
MKKLILFVEDEPILLQMYVMMLSGERDHWDISTAGNGEQALHLMEKSVFDVVVSDMNMPGMNGAEFLSAVKTRYPGTSRIILSGLQDQQEVARSMGSTHQFLAKPFDVKALKATLARVGGLDAYLNDKKIQALVGRLGSLPSFPSLYLEIVKELDSGTSSIETIAAIIAKDPGMTAKMLQIVNSAAIGLPRKVSSPAEAVQFIGIGTVRSLVLSAHIFSCFDRTRLKGFSMDALWDHAFKTATLARKIMQLEKSDPADAEDAYTAGMLHDAGKLMLANSLPNEFGRAVTLAGELHMPLHEAELEVFGANHAGAAAYLLGLWGLPAPIVEAVAFHHAPGRSDHHAFGPLAAVHVANVLTQEVSKAEPLGKASEIDAGYLASIGMQDRLDAWRAEAVKQAAPPDED